MAISLFKRCVTPTDVKKARVIPALFKKGDRNKEGNYAPVSFFASSIESFESILICVQSM